MMLSKANKVITLPQNFVKPTVLWPISSYKHRLKNRQEIETNIQRRKLTDQINLNELYEKWHLYKKAKADTETMQIRQNQLKRIVAELKSKTSPSADEQSELNSNFHEMVLSGKQLDTMRKSFNDIHQQFNSSFLALPNKLSPKVPDQPKIVHEFGTKPAQSSTEHCDHHLNHTSLITYLNENQYFLQNEAATFDFAFTLRCVDYLRRHNFSQFINCDFIRTIILESVAEPLENVYEVPHSFDEKTKNLVHLSGGGSWLSYLGCITLSKISKSDLPFQSVSSGRIYRATSSNNSGLLDVTQSTGVQILAADFDICINERFESIMKLLIELYKAIGIHFRVVYVPADKLRKSECFTACIEMYSISQRRYIEIGRLSHFGDFVSHRLRFQCEGAEKATQHKPHLILGTVCNITKLLAIILETHSGKIPQKILDNQLFVQKNQ